MDIHFKMMLCLYGKLVSCCLPLDLQSHFLHIQSTHLIATIQYFRQELLGARMHHFLGSFSKMKKGKSWTEKKACDIQLV